MVQYPFGYGLSYTSFSWTGEKLNVSLQAGALSYFTVSVTVTNTGSVAGKDVVQLYCTPPYTPGGVEKPAEMLVAYAKTSLLEPEESEEITLSFSLEDIASYDETLDGGTGGYVLEEGEYLLSLKTDAHTTVSDLLPYSLGENVLVGSSSNLFGKQEQDAGSGTSVPAVSDGLDSILLSRADFAGTFPEEKADAREADEDTATLGVYTEETILDAFQIQADEDGEEPDEPAGEPADRSTGLPAEDAISLARSARADEEDETESVLLYAEHSVSEEGLFLGQPENYGAELWDTVLGQLEYRELAELVLHGCEHEKALTGVGKPERVCAYGASQIGSIHYSDAGVGYPAQTVLAQTWNKELCGEYGLQMGTEAADMGYDGWYAPGVVVHRTPFAGANYENSSEDSCLTGMIAGCIVQGAANAGLTCYVASLGAYAQETGADGAYLWLTEQALRETYLSPAHTAVQMGATGLLASGSCTGAVWNGGSKALLTELVRGEWGFEGTIVSCKTMEQETLSAEQMLLAGGDMLMIARDWTDSANFTYIDRSESEENPVLLSFLQASAKHIIYTGLNTSYTNYRYNETHEKEITILYITTAETYWWIWILVAINIVAVGSCLFWIYVARHKVDRGDGYPVEELPPWLQAPPSDAGLSAAQLEAAEAASAEAAPAAAPAAASSSGAGASGAAAPPQQSGHSSE